MSYNFKIGELKENARYTVSTIDKWDGSTKTEEMTGANLKSFTNGCAHLYDIHAEEITEEAPEEEEETTKRTAEEVTADIIEFFENNEDIYNEAIEELDGYNGYLGDDRYFSMDELDELHSGTESSELLRRAFFGYDEETCTTDRDGNKTYGAFNPNRDYFRYNGYGNLVSADYKDYSGQLDKYAIESMSENRRYIDSIEQSDELAALFDELEEVEE